MNDSTDQIFNQIGNSERTVDIQSQDNDQPTGDRITAEFDRFFFDNLSDGKLRKLQSKIDEFLKISKTGKSQEKRRKVRQELTRMVNFMKSPRLMLSIPKHREIRAFKFVQSMNSLFLALNDGHLYQVNFQQCLDAFKKDQSHQGGHNSGMDQNIKFNEKLKIQKISGHSSWEGALEVKSIEVFKDTSGKGNLLLVSETRVLGCQLSSIKNLTPNQSPRDPSQDSGLKFLELFNISSHALLSSDYSISQSEMKHGNLYIKADHQDPRISVDGKGKNKKPVAVVIALKFENSDTPTQTADLMETQILQTKTLQVEYLRACPIFTESVTSFFIDNFEPFDFLFISTHKVYKGTLSKEDLGQLTISESKPSKFSDQNPGQSAFLSYQLEHKAKHHISEIHFSDEMDQMFLTDRANRVCCINTENKVKQMAYSLGKAEVTGFLVDSQNQKVFTYHPYFINILKIIFS